MKNNTYNYNPGHYYLNQEQIEELKNILTSGSNETIRLEYESKFIEFQGEGYGFSLAAGRMAFYLLLKTLNIGYNDEVIIVGFTCSVMINAILRVKATPVYSDVNTCTFGSDANEIKKKINEKTKLIVAQHSFGIPCDIEEIVRIGKEYNIFVLEDCALAFGTTINGSKVGTFGDAALFSSDHTKPINTIIGGFIFTKNEKLFTNLNNYYSLIHDLTFTHQKNLYKQFLFEIKLNDPANYKYFKLIDYFKIVLKKTLIVKNEVVFLSEDYGLPNHFIPKYPYPAKLPEFLAKLGLFELSRFESEIKNRKELLAKQIDIIKNSKYSKSLPDIYIKKNISINPLRLVLITNDKLLHNKLSEFIDVSQTWFRKPIITTKLPLKNYMYKNGICPNSERIGKMIINLPCIINPKYHNDFIQKLENVFSV